MRDRFPAIIFAISLAAAAALPGCMDRRPAPVCPVPTELSQSERMLDQFEGLDLIVVVDNSASMGEEQAILSTAIFDLVNSLADPVPGWGYPPVDDIRIAVVSSDMGLQYGDQPYDQDDLLLVQLDCTDDGDDGAHQTYPAG
ncbi:MAG: hypothetical protein JRI55_15455 [Deltaproteobacteria bacterium]|jgi:hypothetical protein|nr:hypothetical protein [Deltaproteobacteria bacterium]